jgi:CRISPR/Cas system-associated endonuclease/helicase Cas3
VVATQHVEVSLNISFEPSFTEIASIDDLLPRFGCANRYGKWPYGVEVHVARQFHHDRLKLVADVKPLKATIECAPPD